MYSGVQSSDFDAFLPQEFDLFTIIDSARIEASTYTTYDFASKLGLCQRDVLEFFEVYPPSKGEMTRDNPCYKVSSEGQRPLLDKCHILPCQR